MAMPNTLAHLGLQGVATRGLIRGADFKWIFIGCIIPDLPWIFQRLVSVAYPQVDLYVLRLYAAVQASLIFCLIMSLALAMVSAYWLRTFIVLGLNCLFHLLLDAAETKWGNGVHFFAPFDWQPINFGAFWPESFPIYILSLFGLIYFVLNWRKCFSSPTKLTFKPHKRISVLVFSITAYFILPFFLLNSAEAENNHYVKTLRSSQPRQGSTIELDGASYLLKNSDDFLRTYAGEEIAVEGMKLDHPASVSIRGKFTADNRIRVSEYHLHSATFRDMLSYTGLFLVAMVWVVSLIKEKLNRQD